MPTDVDLAELRRLAEAATPGPWHPTEDSDEYSGDIVDANGEYVAVDREGLLGCIRSGADAAYIAAANPQTILALLDRIEAYEKAQAATYRVVENLNRSRNHD